MNPSRLIIGITGASGFIYGLRLLECLQSSPIETHLIVSRSARQTCALETERSLNEVYQLADQVYNVNDIAANIASGSYKTLGMIIAPCSMRTLADIANGTTSNLLTRAADVSLKERRRLILMVRESPLHLGHLRNMVKVTEMGGIIAPPMPAFYTHPLSFDEMINNSVGRVLDLFDIETDWVKRWEKPSRT